MAYIIETERCTAYIPNRNLDEKTLQEDLERAADMIEKMRGLPLKKEDIIFVN